MGLSPLVPRKIEPRKELRGFFFAPPSRRIMPNVARSGAVPIFVAGRHKNGTVPLSRALESPTQKTTLDVPGRPWTTPSGRQQTSVDVGVPGWTSTTRSEVNARGLSPSTRELLLATATPRSRDRLQTSTFDT